MVGGSAESETVGKGEVEERGRERTYQCVPEDEQEALRLSRTGRKEENIGGPGRGGKGKVSFPTFSLSLSHNLVAF